MQSLLNHGQPSVINLQQITMLEIGADDIYGFWGTDTGDNNNGSDGDSESMHLGQRNDPKAQAIFLRGDDGRWSISTVSHINVDNPIAVQCDGLNVSSVHPLSDGSVITILDKTYLWVFPPTLEIDNKPITPTTAHTHIHGHYQGPY